MRCDAGCGECCGIAPATRTELARVVRFAKQCSIQPVEQGVTCPWYQGGSCAVYPVRPLSCRLFGHSAKLRCPHGYNVDVPERDIVRMVRANGECRYVLHDALSEFDLAYDFEKLLAEA